MAIKLNDSRIDYNIGQQHEEEMVDSQKRAEQQDTAANSSRDISQQEHSTSYTEPSTNKTNEKLSFRGKLKKKASVWSFTGVVGIVAGIIGSGFGSSLLLNTIMAKNFRWHECPTMRHE